MVKYGCDELNVSNYFSSSPITCMFCFFVNYFDTVLEIFCAALFLGPIIVHLILFLILVRSDDIQKAI